MSTEQYKEPGVHERRPTPSPVPSLAPATTLEDDIRTAGQRIINLIWETTQRNIAYVVISVALFADVLTVMVGSYAILNDIVPSAVIVAIGTGALMQLNTMAGIVLGFYFGRTNHARVGDNFRPMMPPELTVAEPLKIEVIE